LQALLETKESELHELHQSSHHWWTVAGAYEKELRDVYRSKSWRITWPLRKLMKLVSRIFRLPVRLVVGFVRLPKRTARWLLMTSIAFVLQREGLKGRARRWLDRHSTLHAHLRAFGRARGLIRDSEPISLHSSDVGECNNYVVSPLCTAEKTNFQVELMKSAEAWRLAGRIDV